MNIGLPGSGKTTVTKEGMKQNGNLMRVNRDDLRKMLFNKWAGRKEQVITAAETATIKAAVLAGFDIVIDDTNLNPNTQNEWKRLAKSLDVKIEEVSYLHVPIKTCINRDRVRGPLAHVGRAVIENMALQYNLIPKPPEDQPVVIFDVDGTLADCSHRKIYLNLCKNCNESEETHLVDGLECENFIPGKKDHKIFYGLVHLDPPITTVIEWVRECSLAGYYVLIVSGRPTNMAGDATELWLSNKNVPYKHLFMRKADDFRDDSMVKQQILDRILAWIPKEQIKFCVDDRPRVIRMWKSNGLKVYDVGPGIEF